MCKEIDLIHFSALLITQQSEIFCIFVDNLENNPICDALFICHSFSLSSR